MWLGIQRGVAEYRFDVWTTDSGLPRDFLNTILQSRDGYLWMSTLDGLARFDGVRFTVFNKGNSPGLPSNRITALYEDCHGALWVGTEEGAVAKFQHGRFTAFNAQHGLPDGVVTSVSGDAKGNLWANIQNVSYRLREGRFATSLSGREAALFDPNLTKSSSNGMLWVTNQHSLHLFWRGQLLTFALSNGLPSLRISSIDEDRDGTLWMATEDSGLVKVRDGKIIKVYTQNDGLPFNQIGKPADATWSETQVCADHKSNIWIDGVGSWLGRLRDGRFTTYSHSEILTARPRQEEPGQSGIRSLMEDSEGNLWIATDGNGLIRAREQVVTVISAKQGLPARNIYPVCEDHTGAVWLGTWNQGIARVKDGSVTYFSLKPGNYTVNALYEDREHRLWVAAFGALGLFQNGRLDQTTVPPQLRDETIHAIQQDRAGVLWFAAETGLCRLQNGAFSFITNQAARVATRGMVIIEDRSGTLWIGGINGLLRLENGQITAWTEQDGLPSNHVRALYEDQDGALWIGTYDGGLARFKGGEFTRYTVDDGLFDNGVFQILEDARGNFWMSSNRGIHRVNKQQLNEFAEGRRRAIDSISVGKSDGMLNIECNGGCWPAGVKTRDGKLWFPTQDGVAIIDPEAVPTNPQPPPVVIESLLVDREPQRLNGPVRIPPGKSSIEIQYTGLSFINSERLRFKYRLADWDSDWVEAGTRRTAYYSHLAPGSYTFTVLAANSDGLWNNTGASLTVAVLPAWYQTFWFRVFSVVAVLGLMVGFYRKRVSRLEAQRMAQQDFSRRLIESQDAERKRIAAELHDSLGQELLLIKNRALFGLKTPLPGNAGIPAGENDAFAGTHAGTNITVPREHLEEISRLTSGALQEVRDIAYNLRPYQLDQFGLTEGIEAIIRKLSAANGIQFRVEIDPLDGIFSPADENHLFRIIQEATNNIVKHSGARQAWVTISRDDSSLRVLIEDDGRGFRVEQNEAGPRTPQSGFGLPGMAERVRILRGTMQVKSEPGRYTRLEIALPVPTHGEKNSSNAGR
jgi:signal transduction histidine kinase/ligand-binding sensor domain-containing protein